MWVFRTGYPSRGAYACWDETFVDPRCIQMRNTRRRYYVDRKVQYDLIKRFILHWLLFVGLSCLALTFWKSLIRPDFDRSLSQHLADLSTNLLVLVVTFVTLLPYFVFDALRLTNRFAGPMVRLHRTIRAAANGEQVEPIRFRDGDYWQDIAEDFSAMVSYYQNKVKEESAEEELVKS